MKWLLLALFLFLPSAHACSLAYEPWAQATIDGSDLYYMDGTRIVHIDTKTWAEEILAEGWFLSFARHGDALIVAGQDGLGADCSGTPWTRLYDGDAVERTWREKAAIHPIDGGAYVGLPSGAKVLDWDTGRMTTGAAPAQTWFLDVRGDGKQFLVHDDGALRRAGADPGAAPDSDQIRHAVYGPDNQVVAIGMDYPNTDTGSGMARVIVWDEKIQTLEWTVRDPYQNLAVLWLDAPYVVAGHRAYRIDVESERIIDLGVNGAVNLAGSGPTLYVFTEDGWVRFENGLASERVERIDGGWRRSGVVAVPRAETATWSSAVPEPASEDTPFPVGLLPLLLVALRRR